MPRSNSRASQATVDTLHRLTAKALVRAMRAASKEPGGVSAALLNSAITFLRASDTTAPALPKRGDTLAGLMPDFDELEGRPKRPSGSTGD